jgi:2-keto-3-deoxy-L-rhamnonate aldolase RhmA
METIANLASWFQATNVTAIVRIHKSFAHLIPGILDQGIMGIQVSEVETAQEARAIGSSRGGPGRCRLWRALVRAVSRRSRPARLLVRRRWHTRPLSPRPKRSAK